MPAPEILEKVKSRAHWRIVAKPNEYVERRIASTPKLLEVLRGAALQLRGWDFPHINQNEPPKYLPDSVENWTDWHHYVEYWRFFLSGQFIMYAGIPIDWRDRAPETWGPLNSNPLDEKLLHVGDTLARLTEVMEFSARIAKKIDAEAMVIDVSCAGLDGRNLSILQWDNRMPFFSARTAHVQEFREAITIPTADLVSSPREFALPVAAHLFNLFGWDPSIDELGKWQKQIFGNR
jgi:hypothetical protein